MTPQSGVTGYDCTAHIDEPRRAAHSAPAAFVITTIGTGVAGWLFYIALILFYHLPIFLALHGLRSSRSWSYEHTSSIPHLVYAQSRPRSSCGFFGHIGPLTSWAVRLTVFVSILPALLNLARPVSANAIFHDSDGIRSFLCHLCPVFHSHPEVKFKPGSYYMGDGWLGPLTNVQCMPWTCFVCIVFSLPTELPVTPANMNYTSMTTVGVIVIMGLIYAGCTLTPLLCPIYPLEIMPELLRMRRQK